MEDDGRPFDPLSVAPANRSGSLRDRRAGGLGVHFVRSLLSKVEYARVGDRNRLTLKRNLSGREE
ncbi:MAG: ATP-binding protein [Gammaproteobacteria bacterium]|nr:ATP-binding protein [Gammaproteobacteria bacterium]